MRTSTFLTMAFILISMISSAKKDQEKRHNIPQLVTKAFAEKHPGTNVKKWKSKKETFIAKFTLKGQKYEATYDLDGNWIQTETRIKWEELPAATRKFYWDSEYRWLTQTTTRKIQTPEQGELYVVEGDNTHEEGGPRCRFMLWFNQNGEMIKEDSSC